MVVCPGVDLGTSPQVVWPSASTLDVRPSPSAHTQTPFRIHRVPGAAINHAALVHSKVLSSKFGVTPDVHREIGLGNWRRDVILINCRRHLVNVGGTALDHYASSSYAST